VTRKTKNDEDEDEDEDEPLRFRQVIMIIVDRDQRVVESHEFIFTGKLGWDQDSERKSTIQLTNVVSWGVLHYANTSYEEIVAMHTKNDADDANNVDDAGSST
jgi:hypothetical protein